MKKENITGLLVYILILALAVVFGFVILKEYYNVGSSHMESWAFSLFILGAVLAGAVFNGILFELAHMLGAKLGGYKILSVSIYGFTFYKVENKTKFRFASYDGLTGETKITPKAGLKKEANPTWYFLLGTLFYGIEIVLAIIAFGLLTGADTEHASLVSWGYFILTAAIVGGMILIYNIIPLHLDSMTDGYRMRQASGKNNRKSFNNLLRMENGEVVDESVHEEAAVTPFSADLKLNRLYEFLDAHDYESAEKVLDEEILSNPKLSKGTYLRARAQKIFILILTRTKEESLEFYEKEVPMAERRLISDDVSMDSIRAYILMSGILDKSRSETLLALKRVYRAYKGVPDSRKDLERKLFNEALNAVIQAHPNWELEQYLMKEPESK